MLRLSSWKENSDTIIFGDLFFEKYYSVFDQEKGQVLVGEDRDFNLKI
jgi:hypothetical protein